jgi:hypothetical protein
MSTAPVAHDGDNTTCAARIVASPFTHRLFSEVS